MTSVTTRLVQKIAEGKTSYELSWKVKVMIKKKYYFVLILVNTFFCLTLTSIPGNVSIILLILMCSYRRTRYQV